MHHVNADTQKNPGIYAMIECETRLRETNVLKCYCISISPDGLRDAEKHDSSPSFAMVNDTRNMVANELGSWLNPGWYLL